MNSESFGSRRRPAAEPVRWQRPRRRLRSLLQLLLAAAAADAAKTSDTAFAWCRFSCRYKNKKPMSNRVSTLMPICERALTRRRLQP